jgi:phage-related protein
MKEIIWLGSSLNDLKSFPRNAKSEAGYQLDSVQNGDQPDDFKPMNSIGKGVEEIRINEGGQFRVIYLARREEGVYVLHCFHKKTQKTSKKDIELAKSRLKEVPQ